MANLTLQLKQVGGHLPHPDIYVIKPIWIRMFNNDIVKHEHKQWVHYCDNYVLAVHNRVSNVTNY